MDPRPPAARPAHTKAAIRQFVVPETRFGSITEGNADHGGAATTLLNGQAHMHVKVPGDGFAGAPGKSKAVNRLSWVPDPNSFRRAVTMVPASVPARVAASVRFNTVDADSLQPVAGTVSRGNHLLGSTNAALTGTFKAARVKTREPGDPEGPVGQRTGHWVWEDVPSSVTITAAGSGTTDLEVTLRGENPWLPTSSDPIGPGHSDPRSNGPGRLHSSRSHPSREEPLSQKDRDPIHYFEVSQLLDAGVGEPARERVPRAPAGASRGHGTRADMAGHRCRARGFLVIEPDRSGLRSKRFDELRRTTA